MNHTDFDAAFRGGRFESERDSYVVSVRRLGEMSVADGNQLVVFDALSDEPNAIPFDVTLPCGRFPIDIAIATHEGGGLISIAAMRAVFAEGPIARWEPLRRARQRPLPMFELPTHRVDSGFTAFSGDERYFPEFDLAPNVGEKLCAYVLPTWAVATSGYGERNTAYTSWVGRDDRGNAMQLCVDFDILTEPASELVELSLPFTPGAIHTPLFDEMRVDVEALSPTKLEIRGDVARFCFGREGAPDGPALDPELATKPVLTQRFTFKRESRSVFIKVYTGRRALPAQ